MQPLDLRWSLPFRRWKRMISYDFYMLSRCLTAGTIHVPASTIAGCLLSGRAGGCLQRLARKKTESCAGTTTKANGGRCRTRVAVLTDLSPAAPGWAPGQIKISSMTHLQHVSLASKIHQGPCEPGLVLKAASRCTALFPTVASFWEWDPACVGTHVCSGRSVLIRQLVDK